MKKRLISAVVAATLNIAYLPGVIAADNTVNDEYVCIDLTEYANCIAVSDSYDASELGKKYAVPDYQGSGMDPTDSLTHIFNKKGIDYKKDENGLIYDASGTPFDFKTLLTEKNTVLLGAGKYINNKTVEIKIPEENYESFSFAADVSFEIPSKASVSVNYTDGTYEETSLQMIRKQAYQNSAEFEQNIQNVLDTFAKYPNIASYIDFKTDPANPDGTGLAYNVSNGQIPQWWPWLMPVYSVKANSAKTVKSITFENKNTIRGMNIFALTGHKISPTEAMNKRIDLLPEADKINFGNYLNYKEEVASIVRNIADKGIILDDARKAKIETIAKNINEYENNPAEGIKYLIAQLPNAEDINESNFSEYEKDTAAIAEKLTEEIKSEIPEEMLLKFKAVKEKIEKLSDEKELKALIESLPAASEITKRNCSDYDTAIARIEDLLEKGIDTDESLKTKFEEVKTAIAEKKSAYDAYIVSNYSDSYNAIVYSDRNISLDDPIYRTPNFLGAQSNNQIEQFYPSEILNKEAFDKKKNSKNIIYSEKGEIPFYIDTEGGIILGTNGEGYVNTMEIPIASGYYDAVSVALYSTYQIDAHLFEFKINYADGTSTTDPNWLLPAPKRTVAEFDGSCVKDYLSFAYDPSDPYGSSVVYRRSGRNYPYINFNLNIPIVTLEADSSKIVKSISLTEVDTWRAIAVLGITGHLPESAADLKARIESVIESLNESAIAGDIDKIEAVKNMLAVYENVSGAEEISNISKFRSIEKVFDETVVEVTDASDYTGYDSTKVTFKFKNTIDTTNIAKYVTVTLNGAEFDGYTVMTPDDKTVEVSAANDLDYSRKFAVALSPNLPDKRVSGFTLRRNYKYFFTPTAPMELARLQVLNEAGEETEISQNSGKSVRVSMDLKNNSAPTGEKANYAVSVCLYDKDNKLVKIYMSQGNLKIGDNKEINCTFDIPDAQSSVKCFVLDGYSSMNTIWRTVTK